MPRPSWQTALTNGIIISGMLLGGTSWAAAQSRPLADDTLGNERSVVVPLGTNTPGDRIEGGARRGDNLFHSLQQLNVDAGRSVYFSDPGVNNIITRVTGGTRSQIDGILGVLQGNANLFLINPSGIIFGANATLDVGGSFTATTADAIQFNNQGNFSATNPITVPLLTVQPSAFVFNQINPAPIANNSITGAETNPSGLPGFGLRVPEGEGLTLLGGNISMNGGGVNALGGRAEIGGLSAPGTVSRNVDGSLSFPDGIARADVLLTNQSFIDVAAHSGGSITVNADDLEILEASVLSAGIGLNSGFVGAQAGDVTLNANTIYGGESARIRNPVREGGIGNAGDIRITTGSLTLTDITLLITSNFGQGNAGNIIINARESVSLDDSNIFSSVGAVNANTVAVGDGGDISITTESLTLINTAQLVASTFGQGNAGDVIINARESVFLDGASFIFSNVGGVNANTVGVGDSGDIRITTGSLTLNGAELNASTFGQGNAGDIIINARESVSLDGASYIYSSVGDINLDTVAVGNGGDISITTGFLSLTNDSQLAATTLGQGNAGDVIINARESVSLDGSSTIFSSVGASNANNALAVGNGGDISITTGSLSLTNDAQLVALTRGQGNAGNVIINARESVSLDDDSAIFSSVGNFFTDTVAVGNGGDINITTGSLSLTNGSQLLADTSKQGNGGDVIINASENVSLDGFATIIFTGTLTSAEGQGGDISITADSIRLTNSSFVSAQTANFSPGGSVTFNANIFEATGGAQVITNTYGTGEAGNITLNARDRITLSGSNPSNIPFTGQAASGLYANTNPNSSGIGGTVQINNTDKLELFDGATIAVSSEGEGKAGDIDITANRVQLNNSSRLSAETTTVDGGNITLRNVDLLQLGNSSSISTTAGTDQAGGNGGNINIDSDLIVAFPNENSDIRANAFTGSGGNVRIATQGLFGIAFQAQDNPFTNDITASSEQGLQGNVDITLPEIDPRRDLTQLPENVVDVSSRIAQGCRSSNGARQNRGEFIVKGRGGLPPSPTDSLIGDESLATWVTLEQTNKQQITTTNIPTPEPRGAATPVVEAQGWVVDKSGKVTLIANAPTSAAQPNLICQRQENK